MLTDDDRAFLARSLHGLVTVAPQAGGWPAPRPVWFELTADDDLQLFSEARAPKVARVLERPRASLVVVAPAGEPERWVSVVGSVRVHREGAGELATRLAGRYWDLDLPAHQEELDRWHDADLVRLVVHPESVRRFPR